MRLVPEREFFEHQEIRAYFFFNILTPRFADQFFAKYLEKCLMFDSFVRQQVAILKLASILS